MSPTIESEQSEMPSLSERLSDPEVARSLNRLIDRAEQVDAMLDKAAEAQAAVPNLLATLVDLADTVSGQAAKNGIELEQRGQGLMKLLLRLTEPETIQAADRLLRELPKLAEASKLLAEAPNLAATLMDVLDEWTSKLRADGIDIETSLKQGLHAALWLGGRISETELDRLGDLLRSDVLDEHAVDVVALAGSSLAKCQQDTCEMETPKRIGMFGLLSALRDPDTQRALAFGVRFAKCFGNAMDAKNAK